ncbi:VWA domain-containing protein [Agriterribacter sp.]|uniref:VWA domain-containing protein n=1 Tax=Agriterribacter sp. TaxID=2821509 RepID=UPI002C6A2483|nr:VWA domain-containing protein [Agriterribacter sp.]HTN07077.1 VWA domain-containing protein [Agriterribacter sp.]
MVRFEHTEHLLLLLLIPVLILLFRAVLRWKKNTVKKIGDEMLVRQLIRSFSPKKYTARFIIVLLSFSCLIIAAANLQSATRAEKINRQGIDIMIVLDVSRSMLAADIKPSRLERSKQFISKLMNKLENDRVGLVIFAGRAYVQMPLTSDHTAAGLYVSNASPDAVPAQGTVIADALKVANSGFNAKDKKYKAVILITDGEDHDEQALKMAKQLAGNGVVIHTIGVGSTQGAPIVNPITGESRRDLHGNIVISRLNEQELTDIAHAANGIYQQLNDIETVADKITAQFAGMEQKTIQDNRLLNYRSFFQWFLVLAFAGLTGELFISEKRKIT